MSKRNNCYTAKKGRFLKPVISVPKLGLDFSCNQFPVIGLDCKVKRFRQQHFFSMPWGFKARKDKTSFINHFLLIRRKQRKESFLYEQQNQNTKPHPGSILGSYSNFKQLTPQRAGIRILMKVTADLLVFQVAPYLNLPSQVFVFVPDDRQSRLLTQSIWAIPKWLFQSW